MRGGGAELDPLIGLNDSTKPLRSKLLAVPAFRTKYLHHVHTIASEWLDWNNLGPVVKQHAQLIDKEVEADTRKLSSYDAFKAAVSDATSKEARPAEGQGRGRPESSLRSFVDARRKYLLAHPEVSKAGKSTTTSRR